MSPRPALHTAEQEAAAAALLDAASAVSAAFTADNQALADLQAEYDAYREAHPDTPVPPDKLPNVAGSAINGPLFGKLGYSQVETTRVFLRQLPDGSTWDKIIGDDGATSDLRDGVARASKMLWLSWKEENPDRLDAFLATMPKDLGLTVWGTFHHEPEDDAPGFSAAHFCDVFRKHAPIMRRYGLSAATILMRYTFSSGSGRNWRDWWPGDEYVDVFGCDSYNLGNKKGNYSDPASQVDPIADAAESVAKPWAIGETGASIFGDPQRRADWAAGLLAAGADRDCLTMLWWDQDSYAFDNLTADTWFADADVSKSG